MGYTKRRKIKFFMHISWLGGTAVRLQTKNADEDVVIIIDAYKPESGSFPRSLTPDIAILTRGEEGTVLAGDPFILATPGECDLKGVLMSAVAAGETGTVARLDAEGLSIGHLGLTNQPLNDRQREVLGDVDVLFVPVGGGDGYDATAAVKAVNAIEPRIVIPIAFQSDVDPKANPVSAFLKEMGAATTEPEAKVIIKKKDLPTEETRVVVLAKE